MARQRKLPAGMWQRGETYYARFRANGRLVRKKLSTDYRAACDILAELRARASRGDFGLVDNNYEWDTLKAEFLRWARQSVRNPGDYERDLTRIEQYCRVRSVNQIDEHFALGYREWRLGQGKSPRTVNREVNTLHNMLNRGVRNRRIGENPIAGISPLAHDTKAKNRRSLTVEEVGALFSHSPDVLRPVWRMFMVTGIRKRELVNMRFEDVDFERRTVTVQGSTAKNHQCREIPLDDETLATVEQLQGDAPFRRPVRGPTPDMTQRQAARFSKAHVFVTKANTPWRNNLLQRFYAICKRAGIEGARRGGSVDIHSLRVSFATLSIENGAAPKAVQAILGHSTLAMTMKVYARATDRAKRNAIGVLPFAKTTAPGHVISMQNEHTACTTAKRSTEVQVG